MKLAQSFKSKLTFIKLEAGYKLVFASFIAGPWSISHKFSTDTIKSVFQILIERVSKV